MFLLQLLTTQSIITIQQQHCVHTVDPMSHTYTDVIVFLGAEGTTNVT